LIREFRLAPAGSGRGVSCDANGAFLGAIPLLKRVGGRASQTWEPRSCEELSEEVGSEWSLPIDMSSKAGGLKAISRALNEGDVARAQIAAVLLRIPEAPKPTEGEHSQNDLIKFIRNLYQCDLIKADWDPDEHPRWPAGTPESQGGQFAPKDEGDAGQSATADGAVDRESSNEFLQYGADEGHFDDGVYRPDSDPAELDPTACSPEQLRLNRLIHDEQVRREMDAWRRKGFVPIPNVYFVDPRTGLRVIADYVVSMWVPDPMSFFTSLKLEPILVRDVKTGGGGLTGNQKDVYPYILRGGEVIPVGNNAAWAGFEVGEPTVITEMYVGHDLPSDTTH
jgi:hypothetical protein